MKPVAERIFEAGQSERVVLGELSDFSQQVTGEAIGFNQYAAAVTYQALWAEYTFEVSGWRETRDVLQSLPKLSPFDLAVILPCLGDDFFVDSGLDVPDDVGQGQAIGCPFP